MGRSPSWFRRASYWPDMSATQQKSGPAGPLLDPAACIRQPETRLTLRELEAAASLGPAVLLPLHDAAVAGEEAALLEHGAQGRLVVGERLGDAVAYGACLSRKAAALDCCDDVELALAVSRDDRLLRDHLK